MKNEKNKTHNAVNEKKGIMCNLLHTSADRAELERIKAAYERKGRIAYIISIDNRYTGREYELYV